MILLYMTFLSVLDEFAGQIDTCFTTTIFMRFFVLVPAQTQYSIVVYILLVLIFIHIPGSRTTYKVWVFNADTFKLSENHVSILFPARSVISLSSTLIALSLIIEDLKFLLQASASRLLHWWLIILSIFLSSGRVILRVF